MTDMSSNGNHSDCEDCKCVWGTNREQNKAIFYLEKQLNEIKCLTFRKCCFSTSGCHIMSNKYYERFYLFYLWLEMFANLLPNVKFS